MESIHSIQTKIAALAIIMCFPAFMMFGQEERECIVLLPEISGEYEGGCKKGLAHGKGDARGTDHYVGRFRKGLPDGVGTYTWANGDRYVGEFLNGERHGRGKLTYLVANGDSTISGVWEYNDYKGPVPPKPRVLSVSNMDKYTFNYVGDMQNRVLIEFIQNGTVNTGIENLTLATSSGSTFTRGRMVGYENVTFPVEIKVNYKTWNKLKSVQYYVVIIFEISEPGDWVVRLYN